MTQKGTPNSPSEHSTDTSNAGCFFTVFRMLMGPGLILATGGALIMNKAKLGSLWDFIFLGAVAATIAAALLAPQKAAPTSPVPGEIQAMSRPKFIMIVIVVAAAIFCFSHFVVPRFS